MQGQGEIQVSSECLLTILVFTVSYCATFNASPLKWEGKKITQMGSQLWVNLSGHRIIPVYLSQDKLGFMNHKMLSNSFYIAVIRYMIKVTDK